MVFNASVVDATRSFGDQFFYVKRQIFWLLLGFVALLALYKTPYFLLKKIALPFYLLTVVMLILPLLPGLGVSALGAKRWINFGPIVVQPSELAKFSLCFYLASLLSIKNSKGLIPIKSGKVLIPIKNSKVLMPILFSLGLIVGLVMLEPDLGTATIIILMTLSVYFASSAPLWHFLALIPTAALGGFLLILTSSYRRERLLTFFDPSADPLGTSYHIRQILIALGSGGFWGLGFGQSRQKYLFLPEPATDSIFAVVGEELGFVGGAVIIFAFMYLIWRGFRIASRTSDPFGRLLAVGITTLIGVQAFINLAAMVALVPLTGVPLPLLSYGGSSLVVTLAGIGILLNISKTRDFR